MSNTYCQVCLRTRWRNPLVNLVLSVLFCATLSSARSAQIPVATLDSGLIAHWKFDEHSGKEAVDTSLGSHKASLEGGLSFESNSVPGCVGSAIMLDGKECVIKVPGFKGIAGSAPRTICLWIKTPNASGELVSWGENEHGKMFTFGHIRGRIGITPKGGYLYMKAPTQDNTWHHVAVVVQEASPPNLHDHVKLFRDGETAEIDDIGLLDLWPIETGDKLDVTIGRRFKGAMDDLRLYNRPLSDEEIKELARKPKSDK